MDSPCVSKDAAITQSVEMLQTKKRLHFVFHRFCRDTTIEPSKSPAACSTSAATTGAATQSVPRTDLNETTTPLSGVRLQTYPPVNRIAKCRAAAAYLPGCKTATVTLTPTSSSLLSGPTVRNGGNHASHAMVCSAAKNAGDSLWGCPRLHSMALLRTLELLPSARFRILANVPVG